MSENKKSKISERGNEKREQQPLNFLIPLECSIYKKNTNIRNVAQT